MKRFLTHTILFALLLVITLAVAECWLRSVPNTYRYKDTWMRQHAGEVTTLILGNSLTLEGVNPWKCGKGTFNLANSAQLLEHDRYLLEHYGPYDSLRTVILCLGENLCYDPLEQVPSLSVRASYYQMYMDYDKHPWWSPYNFELARLDVSWQKWKAYRQLRAQGRSVACDSLGYAPELLAERPDNWQQTGLGVDWNKNNNPLGNVNRNIDHLQHIANYCRQQGAELVLVAMPVWRKPDKLSLACYRAAGQWFAKQPGIRFLDFTEDDRFDEGDYFDAHHLNERGADKFTQLMLYELTNDE